MKWGRRKSPSASSSKSSFISHVSPFSWLSKFKQMRMDSEPKQKVMQHSSQPVCSPSKHPRANACRFYDRDDDDDDDDHDGYGAYRRLSFSENNHEEKRIKNTVKSEKCGFDDEHAMPSASYHNGRLNAKKLGKRHGNLKFKEKENGFREERKLFNDVKNSEEADEYNREKELEKLRRRFQMKAQRVLQEQIMKLEREAEETDEFASKSVEEDILKIESPTAIRTPRIHSFATCVDSRSYGHRASRQDPLLRKERFLEENLSLEYQKLKQIGHQELRLKPNTEKQRNSVHVSKEIQRRRPKQSTKVRVYSPRTASKVEICKVKALEDMKKAKSKMKKAKEKEKIVEETAALDSFAVVKCSFNPQKDFRDSMVEMIREKQINQPEEMEELLACYLTLNSDEYHDLIVKVFRQVWFDMSQDSLGIDMDKDSCFYY